MRWNYWVLTNGLRCFISYTNASTSVAVTNATSLLLSTCSDLMSHYIKIPNLISLRLGLTFHIEIALSYRRVWKASLWNICKNKISVELYNTVTVTKHTFVHQKSDFCFGKKIFWQWWIEFSVVCTNFTSFKLMLFCTSLHCSPPFNFQALFLLFLFKHCKQFSFSVLFLLFCYFY